MKKSGSVNLFLPLVILLVLVALGLAVLLQTRSADDKPPQATVTAPTAFTATCDVTYKGVSFVADCNKTDAETLSLTITEPPSLAGVSFSVADGEAVVRYKQLEVALAQDSLLGKGAASLLLGALNAAGQQQGVSFSLTDHGILVNGSNDDGDFSLTLDPATGAVLDVSLPAEEFHGSFSLFQPVS